jgi:hypothetical protein
MEEVLRLVELVLMERVLECCLLMRREARTPAEVMDLVRVIIGRTGGWSLLLLLLLLSLRPRHPRRLLSRPRFKGGERIMDR